MVDVCVYFPSTLSGMMTPSLGRKVIGERVVEISRPFYISYQVLQHHFNSPILVKILFSRI